MKKHIKKKHSQPASPAATVRNTPFYISLFSPFTLITPGSSKPVPDARPPIPHTIFHSSSQFSREQQAHLEPTIFHSSPQFPGSSVPPAGRAPPGLFFKNCRRDAPAGGDALCWLRTVKTTPALGARPLRSYVSAALVFRAKAGPQTT